MRRPRPGDAHDLTATNQLSCIGYGTAPRRCSWSAGSSARSSTACRELEGELAPHRNLSLDLIATADFTGTFRR